LADGCGCVRDATMAGNSLVSCDVVSCPVSDDVIVLDDCLEAENDVDDETMSGENDVFNSNPGNNPSSLQVIHSTDLTAIAPLYPTKISLFKN